MKPHLPLTLLFTLLGSSAVHAIEISDEYEQIELHEPSDISSYNTNASGDKYAFILNSDLSVTPTSNSLWSASNPLISGGKLLFTSKSGSAPIELSFYNGSSSVFYIPTSIIIDNIENLTISQQNSDAEFGSINLGASGKLYIQNVSDGISNPDKADVSITKNAIQRKSNGYGSAISASGKNSIIAISNNGDVDFSYNYIESSSAYAYGGAIYSMGETSLRYNENVTFQENYTINSYGGAVYSGYKLDCSGNTSVKFNKNSTSAEYAFSYGGAVYSIDDIYLCENINVSFSENHTEAATHSKGGAIYSTGKIFVNNNDTVIFSQNHSSSKPPFAGGPSDVFGGAIYTTGSVCFEGNKYVTFEENYEKNISLLRLRSIYMAPDSASDVLVLAAKTQGHITFYDSVYMGNYSGSEVSLNADYIDADGIAQKATGDIVFSGKFTEEHLKEIKGGTAGTATEIANSRTSELLNTVNLYGGKLRVEEKAVLKTHDIKVAEGSKATVKVANAELNASGYDITVNKTGTLLLEGSVVDAAVQKALVSAKNISIANGAELAVACVTTNAGESTTSAAFTLNTAASAGYDASRAFNILAGGEIDADLLTIEEGAKLTALGANIGMSSGALTLNVTSTATERIELNLTLSADYDPTAQVVLFSDVNTVNFIRDGIAAKSTDGKVYTLSADDYFSGAWITDTTTLVYDAANKVVYLEGVANVPEPTSSMLGLMGLVAFTLRRRRK